MFKRKKETAPDKVIVEEKKVLDYSKWDSDFGFLNLLLERKKNIVQNYFIETYSEQLGNDLYITDDDIRNKVYNSVLEIMQTLSKTYKDFLIEKYFLDDDALITFITEEMVVELNSSAINANASKIQKILSQKRIQTINSLNGKKENE